jgi:phage-related protein
MAGQSRTLKLSILADVDKLKQSLNVGSKDVDGFAGKIGDFSKKAALAFAAVAAAAGAMAIKIGVDAVKAASDLGETISKVNVLFGKSAKDIEKFADGAAASLGQTKQQALDAAATFATFGKSAGLSGENLSKFSIDFVKLSSDLASFNNTSPEQAINAIGSALRGEAEPLRQYGVLLDDASLRQAALELGIISTTKNALTPQQKVLAAQALIYQQTSAAQGDFERTSDGLANKTRILTAQLENAKTTIGQALLPIVLQLATLFSEKVIPIVQQVADAFGEKSGGMGNTLSKLAGSIKDFVQPIFEGFRSAFDKIKKTVIENKDEFEAFFDVIKAAAPIIGNVIGKAFSVVGDVASVVLNIMANVVGALRGLINTAIDLVNVAIRGFNLIKPGADISPISKIGSSTGSSSTGGISVPAASLPSGFTSGGSTTGGGSTGGGSTGGGSTGGVTGGTSTGGGTIGGAVTKIANQTKKVVDDVAGAFDNFTSGTTTLAGVMAASNQPFAFGTSGVNTNTLAGILAASNKPSVTVNFNGVTTDPEGTARVLVDTINNSYYRGTGGATNLQIA